MTAALHLYLLDDDAKLAQLLERYLGDYQMTLKAFQDPGLGLEALRRARETQSEPDLVILDVMMPGIDGFEACRRIRSESSVPIIMLTARGEMTDRVVGLELGADDYLPKPFEPRELVARIQSVVRRSRGRAGHSPQMKFGELEIFRERRQVFLAGEELNLTSSEFEVLVYLAMNAGKPRSRDEIMNQLKGVDADVYSRSVDVLISRLRQKLGDPKGQSWIRTVWGSGYAFTGGQEI